MHYLSFSPFRPIFLIVFFSFSFLLILYSLVFSNQFLLFIILKFYNWNEPFPTDAPEPELSIIYSISEKFYTIHKFNVCLRYKHC